ncbi:small ribosomal subunit protein mS34 [Austrofundulus limnaeus]|uniref:28S ribosomal protein S34, mitochondrial n=1 Tax=Austrofundulus limnaeus TaxID=52670 RepID=A0A2I4B3J1_AUSLI|nr:PREDICTED: 28S ribosomal protein S34, mitochondrial [Austrofundulus limnaeus]XP_013862298.1 PREDICTED: 28S ribosomal protein S34, mitochondrial [Austrofundulus limnaeus]
MAKKKRLRLIAEMARKIRAYRELKSRPRDSQKYALDYETMKRPLTGKMLPVMAWRDVRKEIRLFSLLAGLKLFGIGRMFTRKSWLEDHTEPSYWQITKVKVDHTAENMDHGKAWGILTYKGKSESEAKEVDKVMYHDWRLIPKHMEQQFKDFTPLPEPPMRYVPYPPLLRAMMLAEHHKAGGSGEFKEPALPLKRDVRLTRAYFIAQAKEKQMTEGTAV